jgi:hypothetical protein
MASVRATKATWRKRIGGVSAGIGVGVLAFATSVRFADGPLLVFPGGPLRSGEPVAFESVDWGELDRFRELELEVQRTGTSRLLWFSVYEGRPYFSCGFACDGGWPKRWPYHVDRDDRVVLRLDGKRIEARLQRVAEHSPEYAAARRTRESKFSAASGGREAVEQVAAESVVHWGGQLSDAPKGRLYRAIPRTDSLIR